VLLEKHTPVSTRRLRAVEAAAPRAIRCTRSSRELSRQPPVPRYEGRPEGPRYERCCLRSDGRPEGLRDERVRKALDVYD